MSTNNTEQPLPVQKHEKEEKQSPIKVGMSYRIDQMASIDTVNQTYYVKYMVNQDWEANENEMKRYQENPKEYIPDFIPRFEVRNDVVRDMDELSKFSDAGNYQIRPSSRDNKYYNFRRCEIAGTYTEPFELNNYPFDVQNLTVIIVLSSGMNINKFVIVPSHVYNEIMEVDKTFCAIPDWDIVDFNAVYTKLDWSFAAFGTKDTDGTNSFSCVFYVVQVKRKSYPILVRIVLWMMLLGIMLFGLFAVTPQEIESRLGYIITLVLSVIAFQFVIASSLPQVPYLTLVDKYNLFIFFLILIAAIESFVAGWRGIQRDWIDKIDLALFYILLAIFVAGHFIFILYVWRKNAFENSKIGTQLTSKFDIPTKFVDEIINYND